MKVKLQEGFLLTSLGVGGVFYTKKTTKYMNALAVYYGRKIQTETVVIFVKRKFPNVYATFTQVTILE